MQRKAAEGWEIHGRGRKAAQWEHQTGAKAWRQEPRADRADRLMTGTGGRQAMLWDLEKNRSAPISFLLSPGPASVHTEHQAAASGHALPDPALGPHRLPLTAAERSPPAPSQPAGRTCGGQRTIPTRSEINISRETELVLPVFTAKDQTRWCGRGQPEELCPGAHSI